MAGRRAGGIRRAPHVGDRGGVRPPGGCPIAALVRHVGSGPYQPGLAWLRHAVLPEQHPQLAQLLEPKCAGGLRVRIALADPESEEVAARDRLEGLGGTLPGRIRSTVQHLEPLLSNPGVEVRYHAVPLYNAIYRFDDQMLVTPYLYRLHGYQHPLLHLKRLGPAGIFESYAQQFEAIWTESHPILATSGGSNGEAR